MKDRTEVHKTLYKFLTGNSLESYSEFCTLIGKLINSPNKYASEIRRLLSYLGYGTINSAVIDDIATEIFFKKNRLLKILDELEINSGYLYKVIINLLKNKIAVSIKKQNEISFTELNSINKTDIEETNFEDTIADQDWEKEFKAINLQYSVNSYLEVLCGELKDKEKEVLCYYLAKDKSLNEIPFLNDVEKTNTKDKRVERLVKKLSQFIEKICEDKNHFSEDVDIWRKTFETFWSEVCLTMVNKGVTNNSEETK